MLLVCPPANSSVVSKKYILCAKVFWQARGRTQKRIAFSNRARCADDLMMMNNERRHARRRDDDDALMSLLLLMMDDDDDLRLLLLMTMMNDDRA